MPRDLQLFVDRLTGFESINAPDGEPSYRLDDVIDLYGEATEGLRATRDELIKALQRIQTATDDPVVRAMAGQAISKAAGR
jgi:hypothetical protein